MRRDRAPSRRRFLAAGFAACAGAALGAPRVRKVGYLSGGNDGQDFRAKLAELGWVEGRNLAFRVQVGETQEKARDGARQLIGWGAEVLVGYLQRVRILARETSRIPIVAGSVVEPVEMGLARSLREPGGNVTGLSLGLSEWPPLQVGLMRALLPGLRQVHVFTFRRFPEGKLGSGYLAAEAAAQGLAVVSRDLAVPDEAAAALGAIRSTSQECVFAYPFGNEGRWEDLTTPAVKRRTSLFSVSAECVEAGGFASAVTVHADPDARIAALIDKLLRGAAPGTLPFELPTHVRVVVNRRTAAAIGVGIPDEVLMRATTVIS